MRNGSIPRVPITFLAVLIAVGLPSRVQSFVPQARDSQAASSLDLQLDQTVLKATLGAWWGGVLVTRNGQTIIAKGYGLKDEDLGPIDAQSLFDIGSVSKQFTAATVFRLHSRGTLSIDDHVAKFFPHAGARADRITLRHLLTHTSGLSDRNGAIQPLHFDDRDKAVELAMSSPPNAEPGERFEYCNGGYIVLAAVIEVATDRRFEDVVGAELFKPAGMTSTGFLDSKDLDPKKATVRAIGGRGGPNRRVSIFADDRGEPWAWGLRGAGGVITTMSDWARWDAALRTDAVLDESLRTLMFAPVKESYAMGWRANTTADDTRRMAHGGSTRGYMAEVVHYPEDGVGIAVFTNESGEPWKIVQALERVLFPGRVEQVRAALHVNGRAMNQDRLVKFSAPIRWSGASTAGGEDGVPGVELDLAEDGSNATIAKIRLSRSSARRLLDAIKGLALAEADDQAGPASVTLGLLRHEADDQGVAAIAGEGVSVLMMPAYHGQDEQGNPIIDRRPTLVIMDSATSMWPLIVTMDAADARTLAVVLSGAVVRQ